jgi:hypothetical protein
LRTSYYKSIINIYYIHKPDKLNTYETKFAKSLFTLYENPYDIDYINSNIIYKYPYFNNITLVEYEEKLQEYIQLCITYITQFIDLLKSVKDPHPLKYTLSVDVQ